MHPTIMLLRVLEVEASFLKAYARKMTKSWEEKFSKILAVSLIMGMLAIILNMPVR
jgi:hypothetical protein